MMSIITNEFDICVSNFSNVHIRNLHTLPRKEMPHTNTTVQRTASIEPNHFSFILNMVLPRSNQDGQISNNASILFFPLSG